MTFAATANAIVYTGAEPVFVDSDETGNMNPELLAEALAQLTKEGTPAKAIVPVDLLGKVVDHERIDALATEYGIPVLSDAAESVGATYKGRAAASYGAAAAISFNGNKIMTTSGGGAYLTDDKANADHVRYLATQARQPVVHYEHTDIGYNYRLSNLLAAVGRAQLSRLPSMIEKRRQHRIAYRDLFAGVPGATIFGEPSGVDGGDTVDNFWLTSILIDPAQAGFSTEDLRLALAAANVEARPLWKPMHLQAVYQNSRVFADGTSERLFGRGLSLPSGSVLRNEQIERISARVSDFLRDARVA